MNSETPGLLILAPTAQEYQAVRRCLAGFQADAHSGDSSGHPSIDGSSRRPRRREDHPEQNLPHPHSHIAEHNSIPSPRYSSSRRPRRLGNHPERIYPTDADSFVELLMCGVGQQAARTLRQFVGSRENPFTGLVLLGWAGGISPDLAPGDIVVASSAINTLGENLPCRSIPIPGAVHAPVVTVPTPVQHPGDKAALQQTGAVAVEMEGFPLALWAQENGIPFFHARVIFDSASERLPDMGEALDPFGRVKYLQLFREILTRPGFGRDLYHLYRKTGDLTPSLCALSRMVVHAWSGMAHPL